MESVGLTGGILLPDGTRRVPPGPAHGVCGLHTPRTL